MSRKSLKTRGAEGSGQVRASRFVCPLTLLGLLISGATTRSNNSKVAGGTPPVPIDPFEIDDFDGDLAPDIDARMAKAPIFDLGMLESLGLTFLRWKKLGTARVTPTKCPEKRNSRRRIQSRM